MPKAETCLSIPNCIAEDVIPDKIGFRAVFLGIVCSSNMDGSNVLSVLSMKHPSKGLLSLTSVLLNVVAY